MGPTSSCLNLRATASSHGLFESNPKRRICGGCHPIPSFIPQTAKHWGSNLRYKEWESVTPVPGSCFPLVSQSPRSDARCCDAGSGVLSPACLPVSPSLRGQMPDAVTLATGSCLLLVSLCLPVSAVRYQMLPVSPSLVFQSLCQMPDAWLQDRVSAVRCQTLQGWLRVVSPASLPVSSFFLPSFEADLAWHPATGVRLPSAPFGSLRLPSAPFGSLRSSSQAQLRSIKLET